MTGLLVEVEPRVVELEQELAAAHARATRVSTELTTVLGRLDASRRELGAHERARQDAAAAIAASNGRTASLHQEAAAIRKRAEGFKLEMGRVGAGAVYNRLRRERAKLLVQLEDRETALAALASGVEMARAALATAESTAEAEKDRARLVKAELDSLQSQLPSPHLSMSLFEAVAGRAHCRLVLDGDVAAWQRELRAAVQLIRELHRELRAGKYRLDRNSDVLGGRGPASAEALCAAVALGDLPLAGELFALIADPGLFFDHIFHVFRVWGFGLYVGGRLAELERLLRKHRFSQGLRGGYVESFAGLLAKEPRRVSAGLRTIARHEWEVWQHPELTRSAGVVSVGAVALARLAVDAGLAVTLPGPTVPEELVLAPRSALAAQAAH